MIPSSWDRQHALQTSDQNRNRGKSKPGHQQTEVGIGSSPSQFSDPVTATQSMSDIHPELSKSLQSLQKQLEDELERSPNPRWWLVDVLKRRISLFTHKRETCSSTKSTYSSFNSTIDSSNQSDENCYRHPNYSRNLQTVNSYPNIPLNYGHPGGYFYPWFMPNLPFMTPYLQYPSSNHFTSTTIEPTSYHHAGYRSKYNRHLVPAPESSWRSPSL